MAYYPGKKRLRDLNENPKGHIQGILPDMLGSNGTAREERRKAALHMPDMRDGDGWETGQWTWQATGGYCP